MLFYGSYVGKVVGKVMREHGCCMVNIDIRCYVIFREKFSKWTYKFIYHISLGWGGLKGVCVILNDKVGCFIFSVVDNEFYLFLRFGGLMCLFMMSVITCSSTLCFLCIWFL